MIVMVEFCAKLQIFYSINKFTVINFRRKPRFLKVDTNIFSALCFIAYLIVFSNKFTDFVLQTYIRNPSGV